MCGIAGIFGLDRAEAEPAVASMCRQMQPRGPDDEGIESLGHGDHQISLGNRRLAIIDPTPAGHQPMTDANRGTTIVFNGMIYNHQDLRRQLEGAGQRFSSTCDTEVLLHAYGQYGPDFLSRLRGMYALAIWDAPKRRLFLARDPLGIKPLYYKRTGSTFAFASQVRSLIASGLVDTRLSSEALETFLSFGAISEPLTAFQDVFALRAGHAAFVDGEGLKTWRHWHPPETVNPVESRESAVESLRAHLREAVRSHLVSDAPLGVFLSGGIDSSLLAGIAVQEHPRVTTLSVTFAEEEYSEKKWMSSVVRRLDSDHREVELSSAELLAWSEDAFAAMDQPSYDGLNTFVVSRAAHETGLKVALSGLGGDELFDGYGFGSRIRSLRRAQRLLRPFALGARRLDQPMDGWSTGRRAKMRTAISGQLGPERAYELLRRLLTPREAAALLRRDGHPDGIPLPRPLREGKDLGLELTTLELDNYLRNVLLRDGDSMSMSQSLELRVPFLDQPLLESTMRLPGKLRLGGDKELLFDAGADVLPPELRNRPKQGFVLPLDPWMRDELHDEVEASLRDPPQLVSEHLDPDAMVGMWRAYIANPARRGNNSDWTRPWALYALCRWAEDIQTSTSGARPALQDRG